MDRRKALCFLAASSCMLTMPSLTLGKSKSLIVGKYGKLPQPGAIKRIVSAGPPADVFLLSLAPEKLLGISTHGFSDAQKKYLPTRIANLPNTGRIAGRGSTFPMEKLMALKPDLIIDVGGVGETYHSSAKRVTEQTGVPYLVVDGRLNETGRQFREVGALIGETGRAQRLAELADTILAGALDTRRRQAGQRKVRVYCGSGADGLQTGLAGAIHVEGLDLVGAQNVASAAGKKMLARVSMEQLINWNPDVIVTQDANFYRRLKQDSVWQHLEAVKKQRFYLAPNMPFAWLTYPSVSRLLGVVWLQHKLYPQWMPRAKYEQLVIRYFKLFYDYNLSKEELAALERNA